MNVYLPIAEMSVNALVLLGMGAIVGFLSGMFGVGGGFLMTPLLIFLGVPPAVAVSTQANQLVGASVSGVFGHWQRGNVDAKLGLVMLAGSLVGSGLGVWLFAWLQRVGLVDLVIGDHGTADVYWWRDGSIETITSGQDGNPVLPADLQDLLAHG